MDMILKKLNSLFSESYFFRHLCQWIVSSFLWIFCFACRSN